MEIKNRYVYRAKISEIQFRKMIKCFVEDISATQIADKLSINRNTVNKYVNHIRERTAEFCEQNSGVNLLSFIKADEALNTASITDKIRTKLSLGVSYLKRRGKVYTQVLSQLNLPTIQDIKTKINFTENRVVIHAVDVDEELNLLAIGYDNLTKYENKLSYVQDLEKFWVYVKSRVIKFHGLARHKYYLHMKECEFRFNFRNEDLYNVLLTMFKEQPLEYAS